MHVYSRPSIVCAFLLFLTFQQFAVGDEPGWVSLFDGKSLEGWTASEHKESCRVQDGMLVLGGERSHLFYNGPVDDHNFTDFELKLEVKTTPGSNSGVFFHTQYQEEGWPSVGHEAQVNASHVDWRRTGSIYAVKDIRESPAVDDQWFDYHISVKGKQVVLRVNGETVNEYIETEETQPPADRPNRKLSSGTIALQAHDPGSTVYYRNIRIKTPATTAAAEAALELEEQAPTVAPVVVEAEIPCCKPKPCCCKPKRRLFKRSCKP